MISTDACRAAVFALALASGGTHADSTARSQPPALPPRAVRAWQVGLVRPDRLRHETASLTIGLGFGLATRQPWAAAAGAIGCGLLQELWDMRRIGFDPVDLCADAVGAGAASGITSALR